MFDLACLRWKKRRLNIGSQLAFLRDPDVSALTDASRRNGWEGIAEHFAKTLDNNESARDTMRSSNKAVREMVVPIYEVVTRHMGQMLVPDGGNQESKQSTAADLEKLTVLMSEMKAAAGVVGGALRAIESYCLDERPCERAYRPDLMERDLKILAEIDKRIEKTMVHLVSLKEYKKLYGTKEVKARQAEVPSLPVEQQ